MNIQITTSHNKEIFTNLFQHIRNLTEHISLSFSKTGLYFQTMDSSRISIIEVNLPNTWFDEYTFTHSGDIVMGISSAILFKILNAKEKNQNIHIEYDTTDSLSIHFTGEDKTVFDKHFQCPLMDIDCETMQIPTTDYVAEFSLPSAIFSTLIHQLKSFGDSLDIDCSEEKIRLAANSPESGQMSVEVNIDDLSAFSINEGERLELSFSLAQLNYIALFQKISKEVVIGLCDQYPISIIYSLSDDGAKLHALIAPKIKED
jgi:proliferating cell nuclear antigen